MSCGTTLLCDQQNVRVRDPSDGDDAFGALMHWETWCVIQYCALPIVRRSYTKHVKKRISITYHAYRFRLAEWLFCRSHHVNFFRYIEQSKAKIFSKDILRDVLYNLALWMRVSLPQIISPDILVSCLSRDSSRRPMLAAAILRYQNDLVLSNNVKMHSRYFISHRVAINDVLWCAGFVSEETFIRMCEQYASLIAKSTD